MPVTETCVGHTQRLQLYIVLHSTEQPSQLFVTHLLLTQHANKLIVKSQSKRVCTLFRFLVELFTDMVKREMKALLEWL